MALGEYVPIHQPVRCIPVAGLGSGLCGFVDARSISPKFERRCWLQECHTAQCVPGDRLGRRKVLLLLHSRRAHFHP
jgi:hypothetical protein